MKISAEYVFCEPSKIQILKCYQTLMQWKNWTFIMFIIWSTKYQNRSGERLDQVY